MKQPEQKRERKAYNDAGRNREIKREAFSANRNVAREMTKPKLAKPRPEYACGKQRSAYNDDPKPHVVILPHAT
jgi:hypothetical protein